MTQTYDDTNIFARILRGEIPCNTIAENKSAIAFHDVSPRMPVHALVIPRGPYCNIGHFYATATPTEILDFSKLVSDVIAQLGLTETGYRVVGNTGDHGGQEVPHFHLHILGGGKLPAMVGTKAA
ncbi:MAG: HIT domain-containing protein [Pseudomonadota bacterium]